MRLSPTIQLPFSIPLFLVLPFFLFIALGCAGIQPEHRVLLVNDIPFEPNSPETTFASIEDAAVAALAQARATSTRRQGQQIHVGAIVRVASGYRWIPSRNASPSVGASWRPIARMSVHRNQVASYVVHPRTGDVEIDRHNETFNASERNLVNRRDPQHRPLFLLTPSGRVLSYAHGASPTEVAAMRCGRIPERSLAANDLGSASTEIATRTAILDPEQN